MTREKQVLAHNIAKYQNFHKLKFCKNMILNSGAFTIFTTRIEIMNWQSL